MLKARSCSDFHNGAFILALLKPRLTYPRALLRPTSIPVKQRRPESRRRSVRVTRPGVGLFLGARSLQGERAPESPGLTKIHKIGDGDAGVSSIS